MLRLAKRRLWPAKWSNAAPRPGGAAVTHPVFQDFEAWSGTVPAGFLAGFLGQSTAAKFHAIPKKLDPLPPTDEEIFEWIILLESVLAADRTFTMIELGAGYGRWMVNAACACRRRRPDLTLKFVGVEAEPTHFQWIHEHFQNNGLDPSQHLLINAVVNATGAPSHFTVGHPDDWYGQAIIEPGSQFGDWPRAKVIEVEAITIPQILEGLGTVDLLDADIQGTELECLNADLQHLTRQVRRAHISTHSLEIHKQIKKLFSRAGWPCVFSVPLGAGVPTQFGALDMVDGVQSWINTRL